MNLRTTTFQFTAIFIFIFLFCTAVFPSEDILLYKIGILRERLKDLLSVMRDYQAKSFTGIMIAVGWIVTSKEARSYLKQTKRIRNIILFSLAFLYIVVQLTFVEYFMISEDLFLQLCAIDNHFPLLTDLSITTYRFKLINLIFNALFFTVLFIVLTILVYMQKPELNSNDPEN